MCQETRLGWWPIAAPCLDQLNSITHDQVSQNMCQHIIRYDETRTTFLEWRLCQKSWELSRCQLSVRWLVMSREKLWIYWPFDPGTEFIKWLLKFSLSLCFLATLLCKLFSLVRWLILLFFVILIDLEKPPPRDIATKFHYISERFQQIWASFKIEMTFSFSFIAQSHEEYFRCSWQNSSAAS